LFSFFCSKVVDRFVSLFCCFYGQSVKRLKKKNNKMAELSGAEAVIERCTELHKDKNFVEILNVLREENERNPNNVEVQWRLSRAYFDMAETKPKDKDWKKEYLERGLEVAEQALALNDQHYATHKWYAIVLSSMGELISTKEKIGNAYKIKEHALRSAELKPDDPTTQHLLGRWCFGVASVGWLERKIASALFASPPVSSYEEALRFFIRADELDPRMIRNAIFIGDTYSILKRPDQAREWYQKALSIPAETEMDRSLAEEARKKMSKL